MGKLVKTALAALAATVLTVPVWAAGEVISVNVIGGNNNRPGKLIGNEKVAGAVSVPAAFWNQLAQRSVGGAVSETATTLREWAEGREVPTNVDAVLRLRAACCYTAGSTTTNGNAEMLYGYLDDGTTDSGYGAQAVFSGIPYSQYDLYVYLGSDSDGTAGSGFGPVEVNGTWYPARNTAWGSRSASRQAEATLTENTNYVKVSGLTAATLTIRGGNSNVPTGTRTGLAGFQIVNTGTKIESVTYMATLAGNTDYGTLSFSPEGTPKDRDNLTLKVPNGGATLTMDTVAPAWTQLTVSGEGSLTVSGAHPLQAGITLANTSLDVSAINNASLGAVTVAEGKELTVKNFAQYSSLATGTTLGVKATVPAEGETPLEIGASTTSIGNVRTLILRSGTLKSTWLGAANGLTHQRAVKVTGIGTNLIIGNQDGTGWSSTGGSLLVEDGATLTYDKRDTLHTPVTLCNGTVALGTNVAQGNRAMDLYQGSGGNIWNIEAQEGATSATPTISTFQALGEGNNRKVLIRNGNWVVTVAENAQFVMDVDLDTTSIAQSGSDSADGTRGALVKQGAGVLILKGDNSAYDQTTQINGGSLRLLEDVTLGTGAIAVAEGATLEVEVAAETPKTLANALSGAGTVALVGAGILDLRTALTGSNAPKVAFAEGATGELIVPAGKEGTITVPEGATLTLVLSSAHIISGYTAQHVTGNVTFKKVADDGTLADLTEEDGTANGNIFEANPNTWTAQIPEEDGTYRWENVGNWSKSALPAETEAIKIMVANGAEATLTLGSAHTVKMMIVSGSGTLAIAGEALTVTDTFQVSADTSAEKNNLLAGTLQIDEGKRLTLSSETTFANIDTLNAAHALTLPPMTGTGTLVKVGAGAIGLFNRTAEPNIQVAEGTLYVRKVPTTAMNLTAERNTCIQFAAWNCSFNNTLNRFALKGGSTFVLSNGPGQSIAGAINILEADETPVKIQGSSFGQVTLNTTISGTGMLEFADGGNFHGDTGDNWCDKPVVVGGVISGDLKVKVSDLANIVTFSAANTYTGGTEIAQGATLAISNTRALGTGAVTGSGTIATSVYPTTGFSGHNGPASIAGLNQSDWQGTLKFTASLTGLNGINLPLLCNANSAIEIPSGVSLTGYLSASPWTMEGALTLDGTLTLSNGLSVSNDNNAKNNNGYTFARLRGAGLFDITAGSSVSFPIRFVAEDAVKDFTGTFRTNASSEERYPAVIFGASGYDKNNALHRGRLIIDAGQTMTLQGSKWLLPNGAVVNGTLKAIGENGLVSGLTLNDGATLDVSEGALQVSSGEALREATVAADAKVTVTGATTEGQTVLTCANPADVAPRLSDAPAGLLFAANDEGTAVVLKKPALTLAGGITGTLSTEAAAALEALAAENGLATATISGATKNETVALTAEAIGDALELFTNVATVNVANGTITVAYDFGITSLSIRELTVEGSSALYVVLSAKVQGAEGVAYAADTEVKVYGVERTTNDEGHEVETLTAIVGQRSAEELLGVESVGDVKWLCFPYANLNTTGSFYFKVKATKATTP